MKVGDLVEVIIDDPNKGEVGMVVELVSPDSRTLVDHGVVIVYIKDCGYHYRTEWLKVVECSS